MTIRVLNIVMCKETGYAFSVSMMEWKDVLLA